MWEKHKCSGYQHFFLFGTMLSKSFDCLLNKPVLSTFPKLQLVDSSKLKEIADDNFKFDENDR